MNNTERSLWIDNDEELYKFWYLSGLSKADFIKQHKAELDNYIIVKTGMRTK